MGVVVLLLALAAIPSFAQQGATNSSSFRYEDGGIIRGSVDQKRIALVFTGHAFAEGAQTILDALQKRQAKASFILTGDFLANPDFKPIIMRMIAEGHYIGPHSDKHLLYCPWSGPKKTLVSREEFERDLKSNLEKLKKFGVAAPKYWLPAYEWYNREIVNWSAGMGLTLFNYTPGTRSNADYTGEADRNFVSSEKIFNSIMEKERNDPHGLNGFILLMHIGAGPGRKDRMYAQLGELLDALSTDYEFVRIDELLRK